jgi:hypothetical protein
LSVQWRTQRASVARSGIALPPNGPSELLCSPKVALEPAHSR